MVCIHLILGGHNEEVLNLATDTVHVTVEGVQLSGTMAQRECSRGLCTGSAHLPFGPWLF